MPVSNPPRKAGRWHGAQPVATPPPPPPTPEQVIQARRSRRMWPSWVLGAGLILWAARSLAQSLHPSTPEQAQVLDLLQMWAGPAGTALATIGAIALVIQVSVEPRGAATVRVLSAAAHGLSAGGPRLGPNQVTLSRAKWQGSWRRGRRIRRLAAGRICYAAGWVNTDLSEALEEALGPFAAGPLVVAWEPHHDRFVVRVRPPAPPTLVESHRSLGAMTRTLTYLMGDVQVDETATAVDSTGAITAFQAEYPHTTRDLADSYRQRIKTMLEAKCPSPTGAWNVRLNPASSRITVTPSEPMPTRAELPLIDLTPEDQMRIPVGLGAGGQTVYWLPEVFPHMLLVGPTGSGKTIFINSMLELTAARGWLVNQVDPKEVSYRGYIPEVLRQLGRRVWPGIGAVATEEVEIEKAIRDEYEELRRRYAALKVFGVREADLQPRLLICDEAGDMAERLNAWQSSEAKYLAMVEEAVAKAEAEGADPIAAAKAVDKPKGTKNPVLLMLWSLLRLGRQAKMFVITATQRPDVNFIPGEARANLTAKCAMGKQDGYALDMVFGTRNIQQRVHETTVEPNGERKYTRIRGRATIDVGDGPVSVQTFWTPEPGKVITGELSKQDMDLVQCQHDYVESWAGKWPKPADLGDLQPGAAAVRAAPVLAKKISIVSSALDADLGKQPPAVRSRTEIGRRADSLGIGELATLEIDGEPLSVEIMEIEDDPTYMGEPDEVHELLVTYRVVGDGPEGEVGVTSLADDERIPVDA